MKSTFASLIVLAMLLGLAGCGNDNDKTTTPTSDTTKTQPAAAAPVAFSARYIVPLTTGHRDMDEHTLIDSAKAAASNVAQLKPAIEQLAADALSGKVPAHPSEGGTDGSNDPSTFFGRAAKGLEKNNGKVTKATLTDHIEASFTGEAVDGHSNMKLKHIALIHSHLNTDRPDFEVAIVKAADLAAYKVGSESLVDYLAGQAYQRYVVEVKTDKATRRIGAMSESAGLQAQVDAGDLSQL